MCRFDVKDDFKLTYVKYINLKSTYVKYINFKSTYVTKSYLSEKKHQKLRTEFHRRMQSGM